MDNAKQRVMHSKSDNMHIMTMNEAELLKNRYQVIYN